MFSYQSDVTERGQFVSIRLERRAGQTFLQVLQFATEKLRLSSAARRIFDANGREIYRKEDLRNNHEYYISMGENFKDPFKTIQSSSKKILRVKFPTRRSFSAN